MDPKDQRDAAAASRSEPPPSDAPEDPDQLIQDVGRKIGEIRQACGMTQEEMAERLGIALRNYQQMERGKQNLTLRTLVRLATLLGVRTRELLEEPKSREVRRGRPPRTDKTG